MRERFTADSHQGEQLRDQEEQAQLMRHAANRQASLELIALRTRRNALGKLIEAHPRTFALACVAAYLCYSFWHWLLSNPVTQIIGSPVLDGLRGLTW